jgi:hypothetical protein
VTSTDQATRCCQAWEHLPAADRDTWAWQVLHQLAHSSVPFSVAAVAEVARANSDQLINEAQRRRWIVRIAPARRGADALWRGVLNRPDYRHRNPARGT